MQRREDFGPYDKVYGPYRAGRGWRIVTVCRGIKTFGEVLPKKEADALKAELERHLATQQTSGPRSFEEVLSNYAIYKRDRGNQPRTVTVEVDRVRRLLGWAPAAPLPGKVSEAAAAQLYQVLRETPTQYHRPLSVAEQQACLKAVRRFGKWLVRQRLWRDNPFQQVELVGGAPRRGKPQLSIDQGQQWLAGALAAHELGDQSALAAALLVCLGLRASESAARQVSHLDAQGSILRITTGKTRRSVRDLEVPGPTREDPDLPDIRAALQVQAQRARAWGRAQEVPQLDPPLFPPVAFVASGTPVNGEHLSRFSVRRAVHRICRAVGLPLVCPQSLRGTFATAVSRTSEGVWAAARALGHSSTGVTRRHYATETSVAAGEQAQRLRLMRGGA